MTRLLCSLAFVLSLPVGLQAQADTTARLMGYVKSAFNGRPLPGVMISLPEARKFVVTDSSGTFLLSGLPVGLQMIRISYLGREAEERWFALDRRKTKRLAVILDIEAVDLDPIVVQVQHRDGWRNLAGFFERRRFYAGHGNFYTREDIVRLGARSVDDILRRNGIYTRCLDQGCVPSKWVRGAMCAVPVSVDGFAYFGREYENVLLEDVQGVEIYRGDNLVGQPTDVSLRRDYTRACGAVAIWTR